MMKLFETPLVDEEIAPTQEVVDLSTTEGREKILRSAVIKMREVADIREALGYAPKDGGLWTKDVTGNFPFKGMYVQFKNALREVSEKEKRGEKIAKSELDLINVRYGMLVKIHKTVQTEAIKKGLQIETVDESSIDVTEDNQELNTDQEAYNKITMKESAPNNPDKKKKGGSRHRERGADKYTGPIPAEGGSENDAMAAALANAGVEKPALEEVKKEVSKPTAEKVTHSEAFLKGIRQQKSAYEKTRNRIADNDPADPRTPELQKQVSRLDDYIAEADAFLANPGGFEVSRLSEAEEAVVDGRELLRKANDEYLKNRTPEVAEEALEEGKAEKKPTSEEAVQAGLDELVYGPQLPESLSADPKTETEKSKKPEKEKMTADNPYDSMPAYKRQLEKLEGLDSSTPDAEEIFHLKDLLKEFIDVDTTHPIGDTAEAEALTAHLTDLRSKIFAQKNLIQEKRKARKAENPTPEKKSKKSEKTPKTNREITKAEDEYVVMDRHGEEEFAEAGNSNGNGKDQKKEETTKTGGNSVEFSVQPKGKEFEADPEEALKNRLGRLLSDADAKNINLKEDQKYQTLMRRVRRYNNSLKQRGPESDDIKDRMAQTTASQLQGALAEAESYVKNAETVSESTPESTKKGYWNKDFRQEKGFKTEHEGRLGTGGRPASEGVTEGGEKLTALNPEHLAAARERGRVVDSLNDFDVLNPFAQEIEGLQQTVQEYIQTLEAGEEKGMSAADVERLRTLRRGMTSVASFLLDEIQRTKDTAGEDNQYEDAVSALQKIMDRGDTSPAEEVEVDVKPEVSEAAKAIAAIEADLVRRKAALAEAEGKKAEGEETGEDGLPVIPKKEVKPVSGKEVKPITQEEKNKRAEAYEGKKDLWKYRGEKGSGGFRDKFFAAKAAEKAYLDAEDAAYANKGKLRTLLGLKPREDRDLLAAQEAYTKARAEYAEIVGGAKEQIYDADKYGRGKENMETRAARMKTGLMDRFVLTPLKGRIERQKEEVANSPRGKVFNWIADKYKNNKMLLSAGVITIGLGTGALTTGGLAIALVGAGAAGFAAYKALDKWWVKPKEEQLADITGAKLIYGAKAMERDEISFLAATKAVENAKIGRTTGTLAAAAVGGMAAGTLGSEGYTDGIADKAGGAWDSLTDWWNGPGADTTPVNPDSVIPADVGGGGEAEAFTSPPGNTGGDPSEALSKPFNEFLDGSDPVVSEPEGAGAFNPIDDSQIPVPQEAPRPYPYTEFNPIDESQIPTPDSRPVEPVMAPVEAPVHAPGIRDDLGFYTSESGDNNWDIWEGQTEAGKLPTLEWIKENYTTQQYQEIMKMMETVGNSDAGLREMLGSGETMHKLGTGVEVDLDMADYLARKIGEAQGIMDHVDMHPTGPEQATNMDYIDNLVNKKYGI